MINIHEHLFKIVVRKSKKFLLNKSYKIYVSMYKISDDYLFIRLFTDTSSILENELPSSRFSSELKSPERLFINWLKSMSMKKLELTCGSLLNIGVTFCSGVNCSLKRDEGWAVIFLMLLMLKDLLVFSVSFKLFANDMPFPLLICAVVTWMFLVKFWLLFGNNLDMAFGACRKFPGIKFCGGSWLG